MKRIALLILTNLAVMLVLGIVLQIVFAVTGINSRGIGGILTFALVFGFGGAFISLAMSKMIAKRSTGAVVITEPRNADEHWLLERVGEQAQKAGIAMPEVAVYNSPDMNAFATGMTKNSSLVAVSTGLMQGMTRDEVEAVLAHEVSHIANGDMVTLTLVQGVMNTFVHFFVSIVSNVIQNVLGGDEEGEGGLGFIASFAISMVLYAVFGAAASVVVAWFSRKREFAADAGAAQLVDKQKMINALERLRTGNQHEMEGQFAAFGINGGFSSLFSTHPPLEDRIQALKNQ
ncbi:protease HtpX [Motilimonas eburnea]|uniref:protease HtpX n=1 Tax=Motilimonas eburnea TaxID=1737488 RepID=UPI001E40380F|nr:protease HtpX [Motilimonas eburnea]MCE2570062.1 protease HtpX [Motilimonas eburnea]